MSILSMAMTSRKRMDIIIESDAVQYFQLLNEQKQMSRNERSALANIGSLLKEQAKENKSLRDAWNKAASETGHKDQMFHVSIG
jgi:hypothetical protein